MLKPKKKTHNVKGSALLSSVLVLMTTLLFIKMYQDIYHASMENNRLIIECLTDDIEELTEENDNR